MWDVGHDVEDAGALWSDGAPLVVGDLVITGVSGGDARHSRISVRHIKRLPAN